MTIEADRCFEPEQFVDAIGPLSPYEGRYWITLSTLGPYDALELMHVRKLVEPFVILGPPSPTDLFILATGEPPARSWTKIGGLPYWGLSRPWPSGFDGHPLPFLAQFNFRHSRDIVQSLPGDILVIFGYPDLHTGIALEWENIEPAKELVKVKAVDACAIPVYHGFRWRIDSYPDAEPLHDDWWSCLTLPNGEDILELYNAFRPYACQIGAYPAIPPTGLDLEDGDQIICCLPAISPVTEKQFPFVNHAAPISEDNIGPLRLQITRIPKGSEMMGALIVIRERSGTFIGKLVHI